METSWAEAKLFQVQLRLDLAENGVVDAALVPQLQDALPLLRDEREAQLGVLAGDPLGLVCLRSSRPVGMSSVRTQP